MFKCIYLDSRQCSNYSAPYFDAGALMVSADALRKSKKGEYDADTDWDLKEHGQDSLVLVREECDPPGWYTITKVISNIKVNTDESELIDGRS